MLLFLFTRNGLRPSPLFTIFTQTTMHLVYPQNFAEPLSSICNTQKNWKQWLYKICRVGLNKVHRDLGYEIEDTRLWGFAQSRFLQWKACVQAVGWETQRVIFILISMYYSLLSVKMVSFVSLSKSLSLVWISIHQNQSFNLFSTLRLYHGFSIVTLVISCLNRRGISLPARRNEPSYVLWCNRFMR